MKCNVVKDTSLCVYLDDYIVNQLNYIYWQSSIYFCYVFTEMIYLGYYFRGPDIIIMYRNRTYDRMIKNRSNHSVSNRQNEIIKVSKLQKQIFL